MSIQTTEYENPSLKQANDFTYDASGNQFIYINQHSLHTLQMSLSPQSSSSQQYNSSQTNNHHQSQQQINQHNKEQEEIQINPNEYKQNLQIPAEFEKRDRADKQNEKNSEEQKESTATSSSEKGKQQQTGQSAYLNTLRFSKIKSSQTGVSISPSGLTATCKASQSTHYAVSGTVFPHNQTYFFELIFPNGCEGIDFGLIQMPANLQNPQLLKTHLLTYKYKTQKIVGIKVDTKDWSLKVWLNGEFQKLKSKRIPKGDYAFCLKMGMKGVSCILNPFAEDPEKKLSLYIEQSENQANGEKQNQAESVAVLLEQLNQLMKEQHQDFQQTIPISDQNTTSKLEVNYIMRNNNLVVVQDDKIKLLRKNQQGRFPLHFSHFLNRPTLLTDTVYVQLYISEIEALIAHQELFFQLPNSASESLLKHLIDTIKIHRGSQQGVEDQTASLRVQFGEIKYIVDQIIEVAQASIASIYEFINPPTTYKLPEEKKMEISSNIQLNSNNQVYLNDGLPFFNEDDYEITMQVVVQVTEPVVNAVEKAAVVEETASAVNIPPTPSQSQPQVSSTQSKKLSKDESELAQQITNQKDPIENLRDIAKNWDIQSLHQILYIALRLDEQLFAMTLHESASLELKQAFNTGVSRIFTAFGRLFSFYNYTNTNFSIESLAEVGLININDLQSELRHFLDYYTPLQIQKGNQDQDLSTQIAQQTAGNNLINGSQNLNIGLDITVNSTPYQIHKSANLSNEKRTIKFIKPQRQYVSNYITSIDSDGTINIWNTELSLQRVTISDFKTEFQYPKECLIDSDLRKNEEQLNSKINETSNSSTFQSSLYKILENSISSQCKYAKKPKPVEKSLAANPEIIEKLLSLGFAVNVAKKACVEVKNESVDKALDVALRIQQEELNENEMNNQKNQLFGNGDDEEIHVNSIKPYWSCEICTYQNVGAFTKCDMCFYPAPETAYYTEQEVQEIYQEKLIQKQFDEERIKNEIQKKEEEELRIKLETQELEEKRLKSIQEGKEKMNSFLELSEANSGFLLNLQNKSLAQLIVGVGFNNNKGDNTLHKSLLRIRKFAVNPNVLSQFYSLTQKGIVCNLNGQYIQENTISSFEDILFSCESNRYIFETLAPLTAENPYLHSLLAVQEANIVFQEDSIIDSNWRLISASSEVETYELVILTTSANNSFILHQYKLKIDINDPYNLEKKEINIQFLKNVRVSGPNSTIGKSFLLCPDNSSIAIIINQQKLISIPLSIGGSQQNETIEIKELKGNAINVRFTSSNQIVILDDTSTITTVTIKLNQLNLEKSIEGIVSEDIASTDFKNLTNFTEDQLEYLKQQLSYDFIGCFSKRITQKSTIYDQLSELNSKHTFVLKESSQQQIFEFEFKYPQLLQSINLDFSFFASQRDSAELLPIKNINTNQFVEQNTFFSFANWEPQTQCKNTTNGSLQICSNEKQSKYLPLMISRCTGTPYSQKHQSSAFLFPNQSCYQSFDTNCFFLVKHLHNQYIIIDSVTIDSFNHPIEGGYPIGSVLVFTANHPSVIEHAAHAFSSMTQQDYDLWRTKNQGRALEEWEPVACVSFSESQTTKTVTVDYKRCSKYALIMPTALRNQFKHLAGNQCTSYQFVGLQGFAINEVSQFENGLVLKDIQSPEIQQVQNFVEQQLTIEIQSEQGWSELSKDAKNIILKRFERNNLVPNYKLNSNVEKALSQISEIVPALSNSSELALQFIQEDVLSTSAIMKIRIKIHSNKINNNNFINSFSFSSKGRNSTKSSHSFQHSLLLNTSKFDIINEKVLSQLISLSSSSYNPATRNLIESASQYLIKVMSTSHNCLQNDEIINLIYKKFDIERFISSNILQNPTRKFTYQYNMLRNFHKCPGFQYKLLNALLNLLPAITTKQIPVTESGLSIYLSLLRWCQSSDSSKIFLSLLNSLHTISKKVQEKKDPFYNILTSRFDISTLCFEQKWFSDLFVSKEYRQSHSQRVIEENKYLDCLVSRNEDSYIHEMYIDLQKYINLNTISLGFSKNSIQQPNFRIQIYSFTHSHQSNNSITNKQLIYDQSFGSETYVQLSNYSHENGSLKVFQNHHDNSTLNLLNTQGTSLITTRYLIIQINYSLRPFIGTSKEMSDLPNTEIIPLISGELALPNSFVEQSTPSSFPTDFKQASKLRKISQEYKNSPPSITSSAGGDYQNTNSNLTDSAGVLKSKPEVVQGVQARKDSTIQSNPTTYLEETQKKLKSLLQNEDTHKEIVVKYVVEIEDHLRQQYLQQNRKRFDNPNEQVVESNECNLSYLHTLAYSFSQFLRKINEAQHSEERKNNGWINTATSNGRNGIFHDVFETFVVFDNSILSQEILTLLDEVLVDNLSEKEWLQFVFTILKRYLMQPQQSSLPMNQLFSQTNLIKALDRISIPLGEVLAFLAIQLNIPIENVILETQERDISYSYLAPTLALLYNGFKNIPKININQRAQKNKENSSGQNANPNKLAQVLDPLSLKLTKSVSRELERINSQKICDSSLVSSAQKANESQGQSSSKDSNKEKSDEEEDIFIVLPPAGVKRSVSHPLKNETQKRQLQSEALILTSIEEQEDIVRLDYDESFTVAFQVCVWIVEHRNKFDDQEEFIQLMKLCFNLLELISSLSSMNGIKKTLLTNSFDNNAFFKLYFYVLSSGQKEITGLLSHLVQLLSNPPSFNSIDWTSLNKEERNVLLNEKQSLEEIQLILVFQLEQILQWMLEYSMYPSSSKHNLYAITLQREIGSEEWSSHLQFTMQLLLEVNKILQEEFKRKSFLEAAAINLRKTSQESSKRKILSLERQQSRGKKLSQIVGGNKNDATNTSSLKDENNDDGEGEEEIAEITSKSFMANSHDPSSSVGRQISQQQQQNIFSNDLVPVGISRSLSVPINQQQKLTQYTKQQMIEFVEKCVFDRQCTLSLRTAVTLIDLIEASSSGTQANQIYNLGGNLLSFIDNAGIWTLLFKFIEQLKLKQILSSKIFQRLANLFFNYEFLTSKTLQQMLLSKSNDFLMLTQSLFNKFTVDSQLDNLPPHLSNSINSPDQSNKLQAAIKDQKKFCQLLLNIIFEQLIPGLTTESNQTSTLTSKRVFVQDIPQQISSVIALKTGILQNNSIHYFIVNGWLDILLTKCTPKPESFYTQPQNDTSFCKLSPLSAASLMVNISQYLLVHCNFGGLRGIEISDHSILIKLQIISVLLQIFVRSEVSPTSSSNGKSGNPNPLQNQPQCFRELLSSADSTIQEKITSSLSNLITWYIFNMSKEVKNSPSTVYLSQIGSQVMKIFEATIEYSDISKIFLRELITVCKRLDGVMKTQFKENEINVLMAQQITDNASYLLEIMFDLLVCNDEVASYVAFNVDGFQFLLEKIGLEKSQKSKKEEATMIDYFTEKDQAGCQSVRKNSKLEIASYIDQCILESKSNQMQQSIQLTQLLEDYELGYSQKNKSVNGGANGLTNGTQKETPMVSNYVASNILLHKIVPEEQCSRAKLVKTPGQTWTNNPTNWSEHKAGQINTNLIWTQMNGKQHSECYLTLELENKVQLSSIKIGFNFFWADYEDKVLGVPSNILVEYTNDLSLPFRPLSYLPIISDQGYESFKVKVAAKNFERLRDDGNGKIERLLRIGQSQEVKYLRFRMTRPVLNFIENGSILQNKLFENIAISISFISVMGYNISTLSSTAIREKIVSEQESSAIKLIGKLCNQSFLSTLNKIANNESILNKIKCHFEVMSQLLVNHEQCLAPVFLAIAGNNQEMGDWILSNFLDLNKGNSHAKMVSEIVCSQLSHTHKRVQKVHNFVLHTAIREILSLHEVAANQFQATFKFLALLPFAETWATSIHISALDFTTDAQKASVSGQQTQQYENLYLPVTQDVIDNIIQLYKIFYGTSKYKLIIKILVNALNLPTPYVLSANTSKENEKTLRENLLLNTLSELWTLSKQDSKFFELIAPLILSNKSGVEWLLQEDQKKLLQILGQLLNLIKQNSSASQNILLDYLNFLSAITSNSTIQAAICSQKMHINFYNCLKDHDKNSSKFIKSFQNPQMISIIVDILKNVSLSSPEQAKIFAKVLSDDIKLLTTKRDMIFVTNLLVPLLNSEKSLSVAFHPFDSFSNKWLAEGKKILEYKKDIKSQVASQESLNKFASGPTPPIQVKKISPSQNLKKHSNKSQNLCWDYITQSLTTKMLWNDKQCEAFNKNLEAFTKKTNLYSQITQPVKSTEVDSKIEQPKKQLYYQWQLALVQEKDSDPAMLDQVKENVLKNGPFLIIIEGVNAEQKCISGVFSSQSMEQKKIETESGEAQIIPRAEDNFIFYYEETFQMHFDVPPDSSKQLGSLMLIDKTGVGLQFQYLDNERIFISYQQQTPSVVDINLQEMIPIDTDTKNFPKDVPAEFELTRVEYWILKPQELPSNISLMGQNPSKHANSSSLLSNLHNNLLFSSHNLSASSIANYYRAVPVYQIPESLDIEKILSMINVNGYWLNEEGKQQLSFKLRQNRNNALTLKTKLSELIDNGISNDGVIDLEFDALQLYENCTEIQNSSLNPLTNRVDYLPIMPIFDMFSEEGGIQQIIQVIQASLQSWKNTERASKWEIYMKELKNFSTLPNYFGLFMKNKDCIELLFELLAGLPDEIPSIVEDKNKKAPGTNTPTIPTTATTTTATTATTTTTITTTLTGKDKQNAAGAKKWDEEEQKAVNYSYQVLKDTFKLGQDNTVRQVALENKLIEAILDKITLISKEVKRKYEPESSTVEETNDEEVPTLTKQASEDDGKKKIVQKKGIGYGSDNTGQNQKWNTNDYIESKKARSESLRNFIAVFEAFLDFKNWDPPKLLVEQMMESSLLPLIESSLRSGSLLEMSKEKDLVFSYLSLLKVMSKNSCLVPCLLPLDQRYVPKQTESILYLIGQLRDTAKIFINCMSAKTDNTATQQQLEETSNSKKLADEIVLTYEMISEACKHYEQEHEEEGDAHNQQEAINNILELPLAQKYKILLQDVRFDYTSFKNEQGKYKHHYSSTITTSFSPPQAKMVRLAQELADLSTALPIDHTNSIFVRCDSDRVDVMKCLVMGAKGTPYAHGAFLFDVYFSDEYPNQPPKCNLETTGAGKVRFNPNLYACGKVCLSLLGTWRGNASENWDPKISTLLQILVSLQAIIMSEEVYFNEPGFEGEAGTEEGERKNEAYSNIVRYCNVKYAMIDQIKNPPEGFKSVILRHFYLKKAEILEECQKWIKYADVRQASYVGLVNDHNSSWCSEFKTKYPQMLREAVTELEEVLNQLPPPSADDTKLKIKNIKKKQVKKDTKKLQYDITQGVAKIEDIDVKYDDEADDKKTEGMEAEFIDINDEKVKDRWSRYIGAMGIDAVAKQSKCSVFLCGLGSLGVEISKNLVMSGIKRLTIHDNKKTTYLDLSGQFYLGEEDIGKNRAECSLKKIKQLNHYVKVDTVSLDKELPDTEEGLKEELSLQNYNIVVLTDVISMKKQILINNFCRSRGIKFISADVYGPWCRLFNDFGDEFEVIDKNGEDPQEVMIKSITNGEKGVVTLLTGGKHPYEDGEHIIFSEVQGMEIVTEQNKDEPPKTMMMSMGEEEQKPSINGTIHKIRVINSNSFEIGDTRGFSKYIRNGVAKNIKTPVNVAFKSLSTVWDSQKLDDVPFDQNLIIHDFEKFDNPRITFLAFKVLEEFQLKHEGKLPQCWNALDAKEFLTLAEPLITLYYPDASEQPKTLKEVLLRFALTVNSNLGPFAAFLGGFVTQEIVKAITNKYIPTSQYFFSDCMEVIPESSELNINSYTEYIEKNYKQMFAPSNDRNDGIRFAVGNTLLNDIKYCNLFMVGCGAIGCELLKNFAMINLATGFDSKTGKKGVITITDPDHIEVSNLNRQFLFREKHLRKPKSQTAAAAAIQMNPLLKDHILARLDKVHDGTINIFSDKFYSTLTVIANALDNVQARRYVDTRCVTNKKPLLESGTLGPKGHVQVVLPYQTESYGSQQDPQEEGEIPHCTLKMFPEETLHCVEWARDKFGKLFTLRPKSVIKILEDVQYDPQGGQELKEFKEAIKLLEKKPKNFSECVSYAVKKFYKYFRNDIKQLMYTYPIDSKTKDGEPFWKLPKRPPTDMQFDPSNQLHRDFVTALAVLRAKIFQIEYPKNFRTEAEKNKIAQEASLVKIEEFKPSQDKAQAISTEVNKDNTKKSEENDQDAIQEDQHSNIVDEATEKANLFKKLVEFKKDIPQEYFQPNNEKHLLSPEEFEKDEDDNGHIDLIYAMANCRSTTYKLAPMEWIQVKIKAGRIVPALATTTATVAGLQTIELIKILKNEKLCNMKNAFLNLAVPLIQLTEPQKADKIKIHENLEVTLWDRWNVELGSNVTLKQIFSHFLTNYQLHVCDIMSGSKLIYSGTVMDMAGKENEKSESLNAQLNELIEIEDEYVDFIFTFSDMKGEKVKQTPLVRVQFK